MQKTNLKAVAYSLMLSAFFGVLILSLPRNGYDFWAAFIIFHLLFFAFLIILWNNHAMVYYFWKGQPDWLPMEEHWLTVLLSAVIFASISTVLYDYKDDHAINILGCVMCLSAAIAYKKVYLLHAPEDIAEYENRRNKEDTFVPVAECNDAESAHIIKSMLESHGLEVITFGESSPEFLGHVPVRVLVRKKDKETAEKLINE